MPTPPFVQRFFTWLSTTFARQVLLVIALFLIILTLSKFSRDFADEKALEWLNKYNTLDAQSSGLITTTFNANESVARTLANSNANTQASVNANVNDSSNANQPLSGNANNSNQVTPGAPNQQPTGAGSVTPTPPAVAPSEVKPLEPPVKQRMAEQLQSIKARINHHGAVMAFFYKAFYMSIYVVMFAGLIAAIALFFVAQQGWSNANPFVKTVFIVMTAAAAYYGLFPPVFQQQQNISDNKVLFLAYKTLENEVVSYPLTRTNIKGESRTPQEFISYVDSEMNRLGNIAIGFDYTKIDYKGVFDITNRNAPAANTNTNGNANRRGNQ